MHILAIDNKYMVNEVGKNTRPRNLVVPDPTRQKGRHIIPTT